MEKPQYLVLGILAVAVGFFALRFTADDPLDSASSRLGSGDYAMLQRDDGGESGYGRSDGRGGMGRDRALAGAPGRIGRVSPAGASGSGRSTADTVASGSRADRGGRVTGGRGAMRAADEVGRASQGSIASTIARDRQASGSSNRDERLEMLAGRDAAIDPFYDGKDADTDSAEDVVLEVNNRDDVDRKAEHVEEVADSDDGQWLDVGEDALLTFPDMGNLNPNSGTVSLDIVPNWNGTDPTDNSLMQIRDPHKWENRMQLVKNGEFLRFIVTDNTGFEADISYRINNWVEGDAHRVTATWDNGVTTLYVDGKQVGSNSFPGQLDFQTNPAMHLGSDLANGGSYGGANARIKARMFESAKGPDDII